jgi:hypothetical protein
MQLGAQTVRGDNGGRGAVCIPFNGGDITELVGDGKQVVVRIISELLQDKTAV